MNLRRVELRSDYFNKRFFPFNQRNLKMCHEFLYKKILKLKKIFPRLNRYTAKPNNIPHHKFIRTNTIPHQIFNQITARHYSVITRPRSERFNVNHFRAVALWCGRSSRSGLGLWPHKARSITLIRDFTKVSDLPAPLLKS